MIPATNLQEGLNDKEWRDLVDTYLTTSKMDSNQYEKLDEFQRAWVQTTKKALKRIKANGL